MTTLKRTCLLAVLVVAVIGGISFSRWYGCRSLGASGRQDNCAAVRHPANDTADWIAVSDDTPQGIKHLLAYTPIDVRDPALVLNCGTPALAHPIRMLTGMDINDCPHWLLLMYDSAGRRVVLADFVYEYPHHRLRFSTSWMITPDDPRYCNPFPYLSSDRVAALLKRSRGVDTRSDPAPELVFLPMDVGLPDSLGPPLAGTGAASRQAIPSGRWRAAMARTTSSGTIVTSTLWAICQCCDAWSSLVDASSSPAVLFAQGVRVYNSSGDNGTLRAIGRRLRE